MDFKGKLPTSLDMELVPIEDADFGEKTQSGVCLVEFSAPWCLSDENRAMMLSQEAPCFQKLQYFCCDVDQNQALASKLGVFSVPTWVLFRDGVELDRFVGYQSKPGFLTRLCRSVKGLTSLTDLN